MNRHFLEQALPLLGAKIDKPAAAPLPEWKQIGVDMYQHRDTGMMKYTPPEPAKEEPAKPVAVDDDPLEWRTDKPSKPGWYTASNSCDDSIARFWNGERWSKYITRGDTSTFIARQKLTVYTSLKPMKYRTERPDWLPKE